jgi:hypothetical protein
VEVGYFLPRTTVASILHLISERARHLDFELRRAGHLVYEALTIDELLATLRQQPHIDVVLVDSELMHGRKNAALLGRNAIVVPGSASADQVLVQISSLLNGSHPSSAS